VQPGCFVSLSSSLRCRFGVAECDKRGGKVLPSLLEVPL